MPVLYVLGALAATQLVPNWRLSNLFAKGPGTAQLTEAQKKLDQLQADSTAALAKLKSAQDEALAKQQEQIRYSQEMEAGAVEALKRAPVSTEVTLASGFLTRANAGLSAAIGNLPQAQQAEIMAIVEGALSSKQAEVDAAKATLAQRDKDLAGETAQRKLLEAQIPPLTAAVAAKEKQVIAAQSVVTAKTAQVVAYADKAAKEAEESGSLGALVERLGWILGTVVMVLIFANWILPSLAQEWPGIGWLVALNKTVKSVTSAHV